MITAKFYLDTRNLKKDETFPIKIYINNNRKVFLVKTGFSSILENWNTDKFTNAEPNYRPKNVRLRDMLNKVEKIIFEIEESGKSDISNKDLKGIIEDKLFGTNTGLNFINYLDKFLEMKDKWGTRKVYIETRKKIEVFDPNATFHTINVEWLSKFENWMRGNGCGVNYIGKQLRNIRAVFNYAIDNEITTAYPFRRFKIKKEETVKRSLSVEELRELINYPVEEYQKKYRDIFVLMFYLMGINAVDLFNLPPLQGDKIVYHRAKTNKLYEIRIEPEAMEIIQRYKGKNYMLDVLDTYKNYLDFLHHLNIELQKIGEMKRVGKGGKKEIVPRFPGISSYWSRHTWATIAASLDIPKETIAAALGHTSNSVTDIYIKFDKKKIDEANRKVIDHVLNKK